MEAHAADIIPGQTTYRIYQNLVNADDFFSSVFGNNDDPFSLATTTGFYNSAFGGTTAGDINPAFLSFFPELAADSWVTVGIEAQAVAPEVAISAVESADQPWVGAFAFGDAISGQDIVMNDFTGGAWYVLNGTPNGLPDENNRVLIMQITTAGEVSGVINTQVFENGNGNADIRNTYSFSGTGTFSADGAGGTGNSNACGCTDAEAFNYDPDAQYDDGSCIDSVNGCTDDSACNYDAGANTEDGSCTYADAGYDCDGNCIADTDGDGICDEFEVAGCSDEAACNYDADATDDDGSCFYNDAGYDCDGNCIARLPTVMESATNLKSLDVQTEAPATTMPMPQTTIGSCILATMPDTTAMATASLDTDGDGICDEFEIEGCLDEASCNYDADATDINCIYADAGYDCDGNCLVDTDGDGICDEFESAGCTEENACNYDAAATDDDGSCVFCGCEGSSDDSSSPYTLTVEAHAADIIPGQTTYRIYQNLVNADDFFSSVFGNNDDPFSLATTTGFYNSAFGGTTAGDINPAFLSFFPELAADSWVTVGIEAQAVAPEVAISAVESADQPWVGAFAFGDAISGQDIVMNDFTGGAWYVLNGTPNGLPDENNRVLIMQITTAGEVSGVINTQVFENGNGNADIRNTYSFSGTGTFSADGAGGTGNSNACGCTDAEAFNYDPDAQYDDGSCIDSVNGCTDDSACNYDAGANTEDGSCTYADSRLRLRWQLHQLTPTVMESVTNLKSLDVPMMRHATTTPMPPTTTVRARMPIPVTTAMATASPTPTVMESATNLKSLDVPMMRPATTTPMPPTMTVRARMPIPVTTAMETASLIPTVMESVTRLKSLDAPTPLQPTTIRLQRTTMLRASTPFASIPKHATIPSLVGMITASLYSLTKSTMEWWATKT